MDLRVFYQKIREIESSIAESDVVVVSHQTSDGGRAGVRTEVPREVAAKLVVEGKARLATEQESEQYRAEIREVKRAAEEAAIASRVQVAIVSDADLRALKSRTKPTKE